MIQNTIAERVKSRIEDLALGELASATVYDQNGAETFDYPAVKVFTEDPEEHETLKGSYEIPVRVELVSNESTTADQHAAMDTELTEILGDREGMRQHINERCVCYVAEQMEAIPEAEGFRVTAVGLRVKAQNRPLDIQRTLFTDGILIGNLIEPAIMETPFGVYGQIIREGGESQVWSLKSGVLDTKLIRSTQPDTHMPPCVNQRPDTGGLSTGQSNHNTGTEWLFNNSPDDEIDNLGSSLAIPGDSTSYNQQHLDAQDWKARKFWVRQRTATASDWQLNSFADVDAVPPNPTQNVVLRRHYMQSFPAFDASGSWHIGRPVGAPTSIGTNMPNAKVWGHINTIAGFHRYSDDAMLVSGQVEGDALTMAGYDGQGINLLVDTERPDRPSWDVQDRMRLNIVAGTNRFGENVDVGRLEDGTGTSGVHRMAQPLQTAAGQQYTAHCYVRPDARDQCSLTIVTSPDIRQKVWFDITNRTWTEDDASYTLTDQLDDAGIEEMEEAPGMFKIWLTWTAGTTETTSFQIWSRKQSEPNPDVYQESVLLQGFYAEGFQVNKGSVMSYVQGHETTSLAPTNTPVVVNDPGEGMNANIVTGRSFESGWLEFAGIDKKGWGEISRAAGTEQKSAVWYRRYNTSTGQLDDKVTVTTPGDFFSPNGKSEVGGVAIVGKWDILCARNNADGSGDNRLERWRSFDGVNWKSEILWKSREDNVLWPISAMTQYYENGSFRWGPGKSFSLVHGPGANWIGSGTWSGFSTTYGKLR